MKEFFSKKQTEVSTQPTLAPAKVEEPKPEPKFTKTAIGMYKVAQVGDRGSRYVLVEIPYDPETGATGKAVEVLRDVREDAIDQFKIKAAAYFAEE